MKIGDVVRMSEQGRNKYPNTPDNPHNQIGVAIGEYAVQWDGFDNCYEGGETEIVTQLPENFLVAVKGKNEIMDAFNKFFGRDYSGNWKYYGRNNSCLIYTDTPAFDYSSLPILTGEAFVALVPNPILPKSFGVKMEGTTREEQLHLIDVMCKTKGRDGFRKSREEQTIDREYFGIDRSGGDWWGGESNFEYLYTMKEFLEMCPMSPPVSTPPPKKKRKTKADIQEELSNALSEITKKERENTSIKEELNKLQEKNKAIEEEKNVIENKLKKFTLPKKKKIKTTQRAKAWDNIIISDKNYNLLQFSFKSKQPMLLRGPSGTGKSSMVRALGRDVGVPVVEYSFNGDTTVEHLLGHKILVGGTMSWEDGPLTDAVRNGKIFIGHELNTSSPDIQFILNGLLELNQGQLGELSVQGNNGEVIVPHSNFRFYGTYNPGYLGTKMFGTSIMSRFVGIDIPPLSKEEEKLLLASKYPNQMVAIEILSSLEETLRAKKDFTYDISTRDLLQCLMFIDGGFSIEDAVTTCIYNSVQLDIEKNILNEELKKQMDAITSPLTISESDNITSSPF